MDLPTIDDRLQALEAETRALRAENLALRSKLVELTERDGRRVIPAPREPVARVIPPVRGISGWVAPDHDELVELRRIIGAHYPDLASSDNCANWSRGVTPEEHDRAYYKMLSLALLAITMGMKQLPAPDFKHMWTSLRDDCVDYLRAVSRSSDLQMAPFLTAVLACRVPYCGLGMPAGASISIALSPHRGVDIPADAWKKTLENRTILAPAPDDRPQFQAQSPVRVFYG